MKHEEVRIRHGRRSGLPLIVAIHSTALGPAAGGIRVRRYPDWRDGLADALRLSEAMTSKNAAAGLDFGGGKSVIALGPDVDLTPELREAALLDLGEVIESFGGAYFGGPDVGTGPDDMVVVRRTTSRVFCLPESQGGTGSSSAPTAVGVFEALRAGATRVFGSASLSGRTVVISGLGSVGGLLARHVAEAGARVLVSDVDDSKRSSGYEWVLPEKALRTPADILVPAAVGGVLSAELVPELSAPMIVGPANNQLTDESVADALAARGIVWVPDFVASAGGAVYILLREIEGLSHAEAMSRVHAIGDTVSSVLDAARANGSTPLREALSLVDARLAGSR
ncbi:Glu/Leu/Phe/Val dehydrogenase family protein [Amycolatopsis thermophila]|uniref:Leucine dehydrogenase n=1 Tax=Amycolatopsis thermophila TaxID=206084 RepID=A0ABU0EW63_9PSEU|nr:Glu/Leu/Phe/Val dehydrogenase dimerization domain-containing protein [Amycolatopsis thermophila]MDQ0379545.1 leucine dehydrogenase [Amycolatopsis thermophila]